MVLSLHKNAHKFDTSLAMCECIIDQCDAWSPHALCGYGIQSTVWFRYNTVNVLQNTHTVLSDASFMRRKFKMFIRNP